MDTYGSCGSPCALRGVMCVRFRPEPTRLAMPDVCCDLVWVRQTLYVSGPATRGQPISWPGEDVLLLNIEPLVARAWLGLPLRHLVDRTIPLRDVDASRCGPLEELFHSGHAASLVPPCTLQAEQPERLAAAAAAIRKGGAVDHAASMVGLSERQLERQFDDRFGLSPRLYRRIIRLRRALAFAATGAGLAQVAVSAGYADQAHFTRDVRSFMGGNPRAVIAHVGKLQDTLAYSREY